MTTFGPQGLMNKTPNWALWMFRITFIITTATVGYLEATDLFNPEAKHEIMVFLKLFVDPIVYGISKLFGVKEDVPTQTDQQ